jgi:hypothetical protein
MAGVIPPMEATFSVVGDAQETVSRIFLMISVRDLFEGDAGVCREVLKLVRFCTDRGDDDIEAIRIAAASAGDTITAKEALSLIRSTCRARLKPVC